MSDSIDDIWASMKDHESERLKEYKKRTASLKQKGKSDVSVTQLIRQEEEKQTAIPKANKKGPKEIKTPKSKTLKSSKEDTLEPAVGSVQEPRIISSADMNQLISRDLSGAISDDINCRKRSLGKIFQTLFVDFSMSEVDYSEIFDDICKIIFKLFADPVEKCREIALKITISFFEKGSNFVPVLGYFVPCLMQRIPSGHLYDEDMKVFVSDLEGHEAYRRGRAVDRAGGVAHNLLL